MHAFEGVENRGLLCFEGIPQAAQHKALFFGSVFNVYSTARSYVERRRSGRQTLSYNEVTPVQLSKSIPPLLLLQNKQYPNCTKLAREFEVVKRARKRDIEFMKDQMRLPIGFDNRQNGYFSTDAVDHFPELPMSEADVFALFVASKAIEQYRGTPFQRLLDTAFRRLTGRLDESVKFSMGSLDQVVSFHPFAPGDADLGTFEILTRGVSERRVATCLIWRSNCGAVLGFTRGRMKKGR